MFRMFAHCFVDFYNLHTLSKDHPKNTMPEGAKLIPYLRLEHLKTPTTPLPPIYVSIPPPQRKGHLP